MQSLRQKQKQNVIIPLYEQFIRIIDQNTDIILIQKNNSPASSFIYPSVTSTAIYFHQ